MYIITTKLYNNKYICILCFYVIPVCVSAVRSTSVAISTTAIPRSIKNILFIMLRIYYDYFFQFIFYIIYKLKNYNKIKESKIK